MGFKCLSDKRDFLEKDLSVYGSDEFTSFRTNDEDTRDVDSHSGRDYSDFKQQSKKDYIDESDFLRYSKTGDILLYQTNSFASKMVRTATWSNYDHVAMVVKNLYSLSPSDKVYIFESVSEDGVRITDWESIKDDIGPDKFFNKVVYRSVDFHRTKDQKQLLKFIQQNTGKNYGLNILNKERREAEDGQQEEYFCSELIAQAFKMAGVLKNDGVLSYKFTPNSFSQKGQSKLNLTCNTKVHRERDILLNDSFEYAQILGSSPESQVSPESRRSKYADTGSS